MQKREHRRLKAVVRSETSGMVSSATASVQFWRCHRKLLAGELSSGKTRSGS